jgi:hypothetical protein
MRVIGVGPFVGSFEYEITSFRPYARWLSRILDYDEFYVSSHHNRQFLYSWLPQTNFIPLYLEKAGQAGIVHNTINHRKYLKCIRDFKNKIFHITDKEDIHIYSVPYTKFGDPVSIYKKVFEPIQVPIDDCRKHTVLFIDCDTLASKIELDDSVAIYSAAYTPECLVGMIASCAAVICPLGFNTILANLQKCKVLSWDTERLGMYRAGGQYNFKNPYCKVIYCDREDILIRSVNNYLAELGNV